MALATFFALTAVVVALVYFWIQKKFAFFKSNGYLYEEPSFPFGNLKGIGKTGNVAMKVSEFYEKFKKQAPAFGLFLSVSPSVVLTDLDTIKRVLVRDFDVFNNRGVYHNVKDDPLTGHLFLLEDSAWKNMRVKLTPTFTSGKMKMVFSTLLNVADEMIEKLENEPNKSMIEIKEILARFTTDVIGNVAFGLEMNSMKNPDAMFRQMGKKIFAQGRKAQIKILFASSFGSLARALHVKLVPEDVSEFFLDQIRGTVRYRIENKIQRNDMMDLMLKILDDGKGEEGKITLEELAAQCFVFFIAGFETSSSTGTFALYLLSQNQDIQEKLRIELKTILAKYKGEITYEGMIEMKYLQMVIDETLRMFSPVAQLIRVPSKNYKIPDSNLMIPKGTMTFIPTHAIHNDPDIYPEPSKFDPERFNEENKRNRHAMAHLPFGDGPRNCIGLRFGLMQTKVSLIKILTTYKILPSVRTPKTLILDPTSGILSPKDGMWLKIERL